MPSAPPSPGSAQPGAGDPSSHYFEVWVNDDDGQRVYEWAGDVPWVFGRADDTEIPLRTPRASRRHFELSTDAGRVFVRDLGSANGTLVEAEKVTVVELLDGQTIEVGTATIRVVFKSRFATGRFMAVSDSEGYPEDAVGQRDAAQKGTAQPGARKSATGARAKATPDGATRTGDGGALSSGASSSGEPDGADPRRARGTVGRRTADREPLSLVTATALLTVPVVLLIVVGLLIPGQLERARKAKSADGDGASGAPSFGDDSFDNGNDSSGLSGVAMDEAIVALGELHARARSEGVDWEIVEDYQLIADQYHGTTGGRRAKAFGDVLNSLRETLGEERRDLLDRAIEVRARGGQFGEALVLVSFAAEYGDPALGNTEDIEQYWAERGRSVEQRARVNFKTVEREVAEVVAAGRAGDALTSLVSMSDQWSGLDEYDELVAALVERIGRDRIAVRPATVVQQESRARLREQIGIAFEACRFLDLAPLYERLAGIAVTDADRAEAFRGLFDADTFVRMFDDFLATAPSKEIETDSGRVVRVTPEEVEFERSWKSGTLQFVMSWSQMSPVQKLSLFEQAVYTVEGVHGAVRYAERVGATSFVDRFLVRLHRREKVRALAGVIAARRRGIEVPAEGFVIFEGRLVTEEDKAYVLEDRRRKRERERALVEALEKQDVESKLMLAIDQALELREQGQYSLAQRALEEIAQKSDGEAKTRAETILADPLLAFRTIRDRGQSSNRVDIVVLAEGYPVEDDYQEAFGYQAESLVNLLSNEEPYKSYADYFNFHIAHLGSEDTGVDRYPGDVEKDTPLDGRVEWDRFTVNNGKVRDVLEGLGEAGADFQSIVLGNDIAGVATGGGGVACITKGNYIVAGHEVGHSLTALHDEYDFEPGTDPNRPMPKERRQNVPPAQLPPNLMAGSNRDSIFSRGVLWQYWIDAGEAAWWNGQRVDLFEGGNRQPFNFWRPQQNCKMRNAGSRFCVVCMEAMLLRIYETCRPIDRVDPPAEGITRVGDASKQVFQVWPMMPTDHDLECEWYLLELGPLEPVEEEDDDSPTGVADRGDGNPFLRIATWRDVDDRIVHAAEVRVKDFRPGFYRLRVRVRDTTPWVIQDGQNRLVETKDWIFEIPKS